MFRQKRRTKLKNLKALFKARRSKALHLNKNDLKSDEAPDACNEKYLESDEDYSPDACSDDDEDVLDLCATNQRYVQDMYSHFCKIGLWKHLKMTIGGKKKDPESKTLIYRFVKFLVWTYYCKYQIILCCSEVNGWINDILNTEFILLGNYVDHMEVDLQSRPNTIKNHVYAIIESFKWYSFFINSSTSILKIQEMGKKICRSQSKADRLLKSPS